MQIIWQCNGTRGQRSWRNRTISSPLEVATLSSWISRSVQSYPCSDGGLQSVSEQDSAVYAVKVVKEKKAIAKYAAALLAYLGGGVHVPPQEFPKKCIRGDPYVLSPNGPKFILMCKGGTLMFFPPKGPCPHQPRQPWTRWRSPPRQ